MTNDGVPARGAERPLPGTADTVAAILLMVVSVVVTGLASFFGAISVMVTAPCAPNTCDLASIELGTALVVGWVWLPCIAGVAAGIVLLVRRRRAWWPPVVAIAGVLVIVFVGVHLISSSVGV
ncbi:hypothetical protein ACSAGD_11110 [Paramicrobacterium sp. CJ85]|uniref:hypothetical protein n=1 Tax=Paramicrobacterium sp. CJ85 TaxID=3445355 RepID=UPI003F60C2EC